MDNKKVIVITGTSSGFGKELARNLLLQGHYVIGASRTNSSLTSEFSNYEHITLDLNNTASVINFVERIKSKSVFIDALINNAATSTGVGLIEELDIEIWREVFEINFFSHVQITQQLLPLLMKSEDARIINICSLAAIKPLKFLGVYCVSKAALKHYSLCLANELEPVGIKVNSIGISADTNLQRTHALEKKKLGYDNSWKKIQTTPPPDIETNVDLALYLLSENAKYITGQYIESHSLGSPTW